MSVGSEHGLVDGEEPPAAPNHRTPDRNGHEGSVGPCVGPKPENDCAQRERDPDNSEYQLPRPFAKVGHDPCAIQPAKQDQRRQQAEHRTNNDSPRFTSALTCAGLHHGIVPANRGARPLIG